jgi:hypothetical protein
MVPRVRAYSARATAAGACAASSLTVTPFAPVGQWMPSDIPRGAAVPVATDVLTRPAEVFLR